MSVSESLILPQQPVSGTVIDQPLGGNGWTAPHSRHAVNVELASDASGGTNKILVHTDPRWSCVVSFMLLRIANAVADSAWAMHVVIGVFTGFCQVNGTLDISQVPAGILPGALWTPPGFIGSTGVLDPVVGDPMNVQATINNVDTETLSLHAIVYNYEKDAMRKTPLDVLLASIPRGSNLTTTSP